MQEIYCYKTNCKWICKTGIMKNLSCDMFEKKS